MPRRMWEKVSRAVTSDAAGLTVLGLTALIRAVSYAPWNISAEREAAHWLESLLPAPAWAIVWLIIAIACMVATITPRLLPLAVGFTVGINALWAMSFIGIWAIVTRLRQRPRLRRSRIPSSMGIWQRTRGRNSGASRK